MRHLGNFYYKEYFEGVDFNYLFKKGDNKDEKLEGRNKTLIMKNNETLLNADLYKIERPSIAQNHFELKVTYPGLITGVGINHEASIEGEFKLGVHFDPTYGMPIVYGSSVKGTLRSAIKDGYADDLFNKWNVEKEDFINDVFEGQNNSMNKPMYDRDVFFDAVITKTNNKGHILESDSLAPHNENPLKNPVPITFIKIASGCTIEFRFKLVDSIINNKTITAKEKEDFFKEILLTLGVGAKTNVGYGQLE